MKSIKCVLKYSCTRTLFIQSKSVFEHLQKIIIGAIKNALQKY
jgi:hypothetical protein